MYHQFALMLGMFGLFIIGGGTLYFAKTIVVAVYNGKTHPGSLVGALIVAVFGTFLLWYVTKMAGVFKNTFIDRFKKGKASE